MVLREKFRCPLIILYRFITGLYWTTFETTKNLFNKPDSEKNTFLFNFLCGSVAGSVSYLLITITNVDLMINSICVVHVPIPIPYIFLYYFLKGFNLFSISVQFQNT